MLGACPSFPRRLLNHAPKAEANVSVLPSMGKENASRAHTPLYTYVLRSGADGVDLRTTVSSVGEEADVMTSGGAFVTGTRQKHGGKPIIVVPAMSRDGSLGWPASSRRRLFS